MSSSDRLTSETLPHCRSGAAPGCTEPARAEPQEGKVGLAERLRPCTSAPLCVAGGQEALLRWGATRPTGPALRGQAGSPHTASPAKPGTGSSDH